MKNEIPAVLIAGGGLVDRQTQISSFAGALSACGRTKPHGYRLLCV